MLKFQLIVVVGIKYGLFGMKEKVIQTNSDVRGWQKLTTCKPAEYGHVRCRKASDSGAEWQGNLLLLRGFSISYRFREKISDFLEKCGVR